MAGLLLYATMLRINRPVSQAAHELRTPLTGIRGYAEYIMMANITEEERFYAAGQIVESAKNLEDVVEKLLILSLIHICCRCYPEGIPEERIYGIAS